MKVKEIVKVYYNADVKIIPQLTDAQFLMIKKRLQEFDDAIKKFLEEEID
jgi:hypothetical protein